MSGTNNNAHYHVKPPATVLDIGCGDCSSLLELQAMGCEAYGMDPDPNVRTLADQLGLTIRIGSLSDVPFPEGFFDYLTLSQVLEHVHRPFALMGHAKRLLKSGGRLIIGVPNINSRLRRKHGERWLNWHVPYHVNHFSRRSLYLLAAQTGFNILGIHTYTPNLWDELQRRLLRTRLHEGRRVSFFNGGAGDAEEEASLPWEYCRAAKLLRLANLRFWDTCGYGESFLAVLGKG